MEHTRFREVKRDTLYQYEEHKPAGHWARTKKASVDLELSPLAADRQLEDQRFLTLQNRNPQSLIPTRVEKVRSEQIIAKKGASRPVAIKANVLNKIVREASGIHTYAIVPPPRQKTAGSKIEEEEIDETHPLVQPYAREASKKPVIVSFGHRPRSASRTFHPATMRFRLKHGEVAGAGSPGKYSFGLPVGVLSKILHAPRIIPFGEVADDAEKDDNTERDDAAATKKVHGRADPFDLFGSSIQSVDTSDDRSGSPQSHFRDDDSLVETNADLGQPSLAKASWVSQTQHSLMMAHERKQKAKGSAKHSKAGKRNSTEDRPAWDEGHHNIRISSKERYLIKASGIINEPRSLQERMTRFISKAGSDDGRSMFCVEKQELDRMTLLGTMPKSPKKCTPIKGRELMYDPLNVQLQQVKENREELVHTEQERLAALSFQKSLLEIPLVAYHPNTALAQLRAGKATLRSLKNLATQEPLAWDDVLQKEKELKSMSIAALSDSPGSEAMHKSKGSSRKDVDKKGLKKLMKGLNSYPSVVSDYSQISLLSEALPAGSSIVSEEEASLISAMKKAKAGDRASLINLFIRSGGREPSTDGSVRIDAFDGDHSVILGQSDLAVEGTGAAESNEADSTAELVRTDGLGNDEGIVNPTAAPSDLVEPQIDATDDTGPRLVEDAPVDTVTQEQEQF